MSNWPFECCDEMIHAIREGNVIGFGDKSMFYWGYNQEGRFGDSRGMSAPLKLCPWCGRPVAVPLSETAWHRLDAIVSDGMVVEVTAAATNEGIPIIVVWTREDRDANVPNTDGDWTLRALDGESCRWDSVGIDGRVGDVVPLEPPAYLLEQ